MPIEMLPGVDYKNDYLDLYKQMQRGEIDAYKTLRHLVLTDLFFVTYFCMRVPPANHAFVVDICKELELAPKTNTLHLYAREHFKAVNTAEPILTTKGWKKHGELIPNEDYVYHPDGHAVKVLAKTKVFTDADCYEITFSDGYSVICSGEHLWEVGLRTHKRVPGTTTDERIGREYRVLTTEELSKHDHKPDNRYSVRLPKPLQGDETELPIDPYVLGCWLGDGHSSGGCFTSDDPDIVKEIEARGYSVTKHKAKYNYGILGLARQLRVNNLLNNKHIPEIYFQASIEQRQELLQGLMDTDGTCDTRGTATFCQKGSLLSEQVFELAQSLGLYPSLRQHQAQVNGEPYPFHQVSFQAYKSFPVFKLDRKYQRSKDKDRTYLSKFIHSVKPVESIPVNCIQVDSPDGLYLVGYQLTTTHNSTVITQAETIQDILKYPDRSNCILSYARAAAMMFLRSIKNILESSEFLKELFPDILYLNPKQDAYRWSEDAGLYVKRDSFQKEATLEAWGLIDGQPTGRHFDKLIYDDVVTIEVGRSPEMREKVKEAFDMSNNLGKDGGRRRVIGTYYNHDDPLVYIAGLKDPLTGTPIFTQYVRPATDNGEANGEPVLLSHKRLAELRSGDLYTFNCQQLLNPTPTTDMKLDPENLRMVDVERIPKNLFKFMIIDPAGMQTNKIKRGDSWSILVIGVRPYRDDIGASDVYLLDLVVDPMDEITAMQNIIDVYKRNGRILKVGVEKVGLSTMEIHVANALRSHGVNLSVEGGNLELLTPAGRPKETRIERGVCWPLANGKIFVSKAIKQTYVERLRLEMEKFPHWHDDVLDTISYGYDLIGDYKFGEFIDDEEGEEWDAYEKALNEYLEASDSEREWMTQ